jgi:hypothetical protein
MQKTIPQIDIKPVSTRFDLLTGELVSFLENGMLPVTKTALIAYASECSKFETRIISIKSELSITKSELSRDFRSHYKRVYQSTNLGQKWETKISVDMDPIISDITMNLDKLSAMLSVLEDFKWTLKSNRDIAKDYVFHLSE